MARVAHEHVLQYPRSLVWQEWPVALSHDGHSHLLQRWPQRVSALICGRWATSSSYNIATYVCYPLCSLRLNDFRVNGIPSSLESEAGKILRALHGEQALDKNLVC